MALNEELYRDFFDEAILVFDVSCRKNLCNVYTSDSAFSLNAFNTS